MDAVVLAAGRGIRLGKLTETIPKVLVPVNGRPLLDYHLEALRAAGIRRVLLVVHYRAEQVEQHVDRGRPFDLDVEVVRQSEPLGTGDAVRVAAPEIRTDFFVVCYADTFVSGEARLLKELLADSTSKIVAAQVPDGGSYGRLETREVRGRLELVDLREKDGQPVAALVNAGLYLLPRSILPLVAALPRSVRGEFELTDAIRNYVVTGGVLRVIPVSEWVDAGTRESLARAEALARARPR